MRRWLALAAVAACLPFGAVAQQATAELPAAAKGVLIINRDVVLTESEPARRLQDLERARRAALQASFDKLNTSLEAEEADIARVRDQLSKRDFEVRVRDFDLRVQDARRSSQAANEALQAEFSAARRKLAQALNPILQDILVSRGAVVMLNAQTVIMARGDIDVTREAIERFSKIEIDFDLAPVSGDDGG